MSSHSMDEERAQVLQAYKAKVREHREMESRVKTLRDNVKALVKEYNKTEDDLKALQSVGQIIGEVLRQLDDDRFIVKASSGPRYVVGCRTKVDKTKLKSGTRVALDMTTLTIMRALPREVDPTVYHMLNEDAGKVSFSSIGGLNEQIRELREVVELPLTNPELFVRVGIKPPKGVLLYGPPGTGKTLLAKAVANVCHSTFFNVSASTLASKYRGESEKMVRVLFDMARYYSPAIIFMDEIDAIAGARGGAQEHESSRRVKTELLVQMNGVSSGDPGDPNNRVMVLAATNLPWELDEAMRRRLTKRVYIPLPGTDGRRQLFQLNLGKVDVAPDIDYDKLVASTDGYSGDDICGLCETAKMMPVKRLYTPEVLKELHRKKQEGVSEEELQAHEKNALVVTWADFETALENVSKSVGADQLERFAKWEEEFGSK